MSNTRYRLVEFAELDSTNSYARARLRELGDGDVIQAGIQTAGRGRWQRKWVSDSPGNLYLSLVLKPAGPPARLPLASLSQLLAVNTCHALESHGQMPALKWPNDIQVDGRKIAGILAETVVSGSDFLGLVLGIGVNLNLTEASLQQIDQPATALNLLLGHAADARAFRDLLLHTFFARYDVFLAAGFPPIREEYRQRCRFLGRAIEVRGPHGTIRGIARDISEAGELELETGDGRRQWIVQGEIVSAL